MKFLTYHDCKQESQEKFLISHFICFLKCNLSFYITQFSSFLYTKVFPRYGFILGHLYVPLIINYLKEVLLIEKT